MTRYEHSSTDDEMISNNNSFETPVYSPFDLNEENELTTDDDEEDQNNQPPPLTSEQRKVHKIAWDVYTSRSRKLTKEELALVAVYGPPEDSEQDDNVEEEEDIDGMLIVSSSNPTELAPQQQTTPPTEIVYDEYPVEPLENNDYNEYEQIFFDSDEEEQKPKKNKRRKKQPDDSDGEFEPKYPKGKSKSSKGAKNLRNRRAPSPIPEPPPPPPQVPILLADTIVCFHCGQGDREDELLLCDKCDKGWHMSCLDPPLLQLPAENEQWFCPHCVQESTKQKQQEMLELGDIIREKERVLKQIRANLLKKKSEKAELHQQPIAVEKPSDPKPPDEEPKETHPPRPDSSSKTSSSSSSNLLLLNKSFAINSKNIQIVNKAISSPSRVPFWTGSLNWDDKCICKVAVYFPPESTPICHDLKANWPTILKITSTKELPVNFQRSFQCTNVEIVPESDHASFTYFLHSIDRNGTVGTHWLGAIGPSIYFLLNKNKKSLTVYVPTKPDKQPAPVQYLMQLGPNQFLPVSLAATPGEQRVVMPLQYIQVPNNTFVPPIKIANSVNKI